MLQCIKPLSYGDFPCNTESRQFYNALDHSVMEVPLNLEHLQHCDREQSILHCIRPLSYGVVPHPQRSECIFKRLSSPIMAPFKQTSRNMQKYITIYDFNIISSFSIKSQAESIGKHMKHYSSNLTALRKYSCWI